MALALAEAGADVAITSRSADDAERSAPKIRDATGRKVLALALDVRDEAAVERTVDAVLREFGHIDILVNNAGNVVSTPENAPFEKRPGELWHNTIDVNLHGVFYCGKHVVAKAMKPPGRARSSTSPRPPASSARTGGSTRARPWAGPRSTTTRPRGR